MPAGCETEFLLPTAIDKLMVHNGKVQSSPRLIFCVKFEQQIIIAFT